MKVRTIRCLQAAVLVLAGMAVYAPALRGGWLWDDAFEVPQNQALRSWAGLRSIWVAPDGPDYFPLKSTVQWLEWHAWGDRPAGYHLVSLALHLLSAFLVWRLLAWLARLEGAEDDAVWPWLGGLLFLVHPLAVESVAWIAELKNTLSLPFLLLAFWAYAAAGERSREEKAGWLGIYLLSLGLFAAAMLSKSSVVMLPVVLLLYAWWRRGRVEGRDWAASAAFFAISLVLGLVTVEFQRHRAIAGLNLGLGGWGARWARAGLALAFYVEKSLWPIRLLPAYPRWEIDPKEAVLWLPWFGLALLVAACWRKRAGWGRHALFGLGWFGLNLLPVLGFVPMAYQRISWVADHLAYVPLLGWIGLAAAGAGAIERRAGRGAAAAIVLAVAALLAAEARHYAENYTDENRLWSQTLRLDPDNWVAQRNLGNALLQRGRLDDAIRHYEAAVRLKPELADAHNNLGLALESAGRPAEGVKECEWALRLQPRYAEADNNLGLALQAEGRWPEALASFETAVSLKPGYADAQGNLAFALAHAGRWNEAIGHYQASLILNPDNAWTEYNLGNTLFTVGRWSEAAGHYRASLRLDPDSAETENNLGLALFKSGRPDEAVAAYAAALKLDPSRAEVHGNWGDLLLARRLFAEAARHYEAALRLDPGNATAHGNLGNAFLLEGKLMEAMAEYETALRLDPGLEMIRHNLALARSMSARPTEQEKHP